MRTPIPALLLLTVACSNDIALQPVRIPPDVEILYPSVGDSVPSGAPFQLAAAVSANGGHLFDETDLTYVWSSDLYGSFEGESRVEGGGVFLDVPGVPVPGTHRIQLTATGPSGSDTGAALLIVLPNTAPVVRITTPEDGATVAYDAPLGITAVITDGEEPVEALTLEWSLDGAPLAAPIRPDSGGVATVQLPGIAVGSHVLEVVARDSAGVEGVAVAGITAVEPDADGDGVITDALPGGLDCDDTDPAVFPGALEVCNGYDDDCNGLVDDDDYVAPGVAPTWHADRDADGFGAPADTIEACECPAGFLPDASDCDDADPFVNPDAVEVCNGGDDDCDGLRDDGDPDVLATDRWYPDADGDGFGDASSAGALRCAPLPGERPDRDDCDDATFAVNPAAPEVCNGGVDDDCSGLADDADPGLDLLTRTAWWPDLDGDGWGAGAQTTACAAPVGHADRDGDCNDAAPAIHPGAVEVCNSGIDDDCDLLADDLDPGLELASATTWHRDLDGDAFGDPALTARFCVVQPGWVSDATDCDDAENRAYPGNVEVCDGIDNDCVNGADDADPNLVGGFAFHRDADGDLWGADAADTFCVAPAGWVAGGGDCDDARADVNPDAPEVCDGIDDDCDGLVDDEDDDLDPAGTVSGMFDQDGDGWGAWREHVCDGGRLAVYGPETDCQDGNGAVYPGAPEICDNLVDDDCSGDDVGCRFDDDYPLDGGLPPGKGLIRIYGATGDNLGTALAAAADDAGSPMLLVGATGRGPSAVGAALLWRGTLTRDATYRAGSEDLLITGVDGSGKLGSAVALADLDGAGEPDLVVAASNAYGVGGSRTGVVYVFDGSTAGSGAVLATDAELVIDGVDSGSDFGFRAVVGDLTCDGQPDLVVSAPSHANGAVYVFFGPLDLRPGTSLTADDANVAITGEASGDRFGSSIALVGDTSGMEPGCDDLLVGAEKWGALEGAAYLYSAQAAMFHGKGAAAAPIAADADVAQVVWYGTQGWLGSAVAGIGDADGNGQADIALGANHYDTPASQGGKVWVFLNPLSNPGSQSVHADVDAAGADLTWYHPVSDSWVGSAIADVGDTNGDGLHELVVGGAHVGNSKAGSAYLFYGDWTATPSGAIDALAPASFSGEPSDNLGDAIVPVGNLDGDAGGRQDFAITASAAEDPGGSGLNQGVVYVVLGTNQ